MAFAVYQETLRNPAKFADVYKLALHLAVCPNQSVIELHISRETLYIVLFLTVSVEAEDLKIITFEPILQCDQGRHLSTARSAPRGPQIQEKHLSFFIGYFESRSV